MVLYKEYVSFALSSNGHFGGRLFRLYSYTHYRVIVIIVFPSRRSSLSRTTAGLCQLPWKTFAEGVLKDQAVVIVFWKCDELIAVIAALVVLV
jgi:hypothetical protein